MDDSVTKKRGKVKLLAFVGFAASVVLFGAMLLAHSNSTTPSPEPTEAQLSGSPEWTGTEQAASGSSPESEIPKLAGAIFDGNERRALKQMTGGEFSKVFVFPDKVSIEVNFSQLEREGAAINFPPNTTVPAVFSELMSLAESGNVAAASRALDRLQECDHLPKTDDELDESIRKIESGEVASGTAQPIDESIAAIRALSSKCIGVTQGMYDEALAHIDANIDIVSTREANRLGDYFAEKDAKRAVSYYRHAWEKNGSAMAAQGLARVLASSDVPIETNFAEIESLKYVANAIMLSYYDGLDGEVVKRAAQELVQKMEVQERELSPSTMREVYERAGEMMKARACCAL